MVKAHRLLSIERGDYPRLRLLAPVFGVMAACTVVLASLSKALFLSQNPISLLPWMFLGSALLTAASSLGYVGLMRAMGIASRFRLLLLVAVLSLVGVRFAFPLAPSSMGIVILLWCPTIGHLLVVQTWNVASSLLPTRQGKRMMPVLAAVSTLGAALGGLGIQALLTWLQAEDLLVVAAGLLIYPLLRIGHLIAGLGEEAAPLRRERPSAGATSEVGRGLDSIRKRPLLTDVAWLTFLLQAASLIVDYQFSASLQPQFDKEGIASFLGFFFWTSNLLVLALTLLFTNRFIRSVGIGLALASSGVVIGVGSAVYFVSAVGASFPLFWVIAVTAFAERTTSYAFAKPATQMVYMPLHAAGGERAKTIIDGVVYRIATGVVSVLLLLAAPDLTSQFRLSLPALLACTVVVYLGTRVGPGYREALFDALRSRRIGATLARYLGDGLQGGAEQLVVDQLDSERPRDVLRALDMAREMEVPLPANRLEELALHPDEAVAKAALAVMDALDQKLSAAQIERLLAPSRPPAVLRALLGRLDDRPSAEAAALVRPLVDHEDPGVAAAACVYRIRAAGAVDAFDAEVAGKTASVRLTGMTRAGAFARELPELLRHPKPDVRRDAIAHMGELGLEIFIPPLIACLDAADARRGACEALLPFGDRAVARLAEHFDGDDLGATGKAAAVAVVERMGTAAAVRVLVDVASVGTTPLRDQAVAALWRLAADPDAPRPEPSCLDSCIRAELDHLELLSRVELSMQLALTGGGRRGLFFAAEVTSLQVAGERRLFRLLSLVYDREVLRSAWLHYRSPEARMRSNAIELLEQHLDDPEHRRFVALIERQEDDAGHTRPRSIVGQPVTDEEGLVALVARDRWLERLWAWVRQGEPKRPLDWHDPFDRLVILRQLPAFAGAPGEPLLEVGRRMARIELEAGSRVYAQGEASRDVFWILEGDVVLEAPSTEVGVRAYDGFGEMEALDGGQRACAAVARCEACVVRLTWPDFEDAIILLPELLHGVLRTLSRRLRGSPRANGETP